MTACAATVRALAEFPQRLRMHYAAIPADAAQWTPDCWDGIPSERFSALAQLCHLRDIEIDGYHARFRRTLGETHPALPDLDSDMLARRRDYAGEGDADAVLQAFERARAQTVALLGSLTRGQWARTADFGSYGPVTVRALAHYLCSHDQQHLAGLQWLLGKLHAPHAGLS